MKPPLVLDEEMLAVAVSFFVVPCIGFVHILDDIQRVLPDEMFEQLVADSEFYFM